MKQVIPILLFFLLLSLTSIPVNAQQTLQDRILIPISAEDAETITSVVKEIVAEAQKTELEQIRILVFPFYGNNYNPETIDFNTRMLMVKETEDFRASVELNCMMLAQPERTCVVQVAPVFNQADANDPSLLEFFDPNPQAIFFQGVQDKAAQILSNTALEQAFKDAYEAGTRVVGTSLGSNLLSTSMIAGYKDGFSAGSALQFGSVDVWNSQSQRGLDFGLKEAVLDTYIFRHNHLSRLLNAITLPGNPQIGIGIDGNTGIHITEEQEIKDIFGEYSVAILDAQTYHAAAAVQYRYPENTLSLRNVLFHLLAPGDYSYDLQEKTTSILAPPEKLARTYSGIKLDPNEGPLVVGGNLLFGKDGNPRLSLNGNKVINRFVNLSGGSKANILIITTGFPSLKEATATARYYSSAIQASTEVVDLDSNDLPGFSPSEEYTGMLVIGGDQSRIDPQYLAGVKTAWQAGLPLMVDGAASALVGKYYNYHPNTHPLEPEKDYDASQEALLINNAQVKPGLDLFDATIEPMAMIGNRWGWIIANSYAHPSLPSFGISEEAALEISSNGVVVLGEGPVFVLDLSQADLTTGDNGAYVFANGLLDVFAPLEVVFPEVADQNIAPIPPSTPDLTTPTPVTIVITPNSSPTPLPTLTVTQDSPLQFPKPAPTRTPRPTSTPLTVPPPPDSGQINLMILIASLSVLIVIFGVWINRNRIE